MERRNKVDERTRRGDDTGPLISGLLAIIGTGGILIFATLIVLSSPGADRSASLPIEATQPQTSIQKK